MNMQIYGQDMAPLVPVQNYGVPTALMSGDVDPLADPIDVQWITEQLGSNVVFAKQYHMNHTGFAMANDMSFFSEDAVALLHQYNPVAYHHSWGYLNPWAGFLN